MSDTQPPSNPSQPYPQGQQPQGYGQPQQPGNFPPQGYYQGPPPKKKHTLRNIIIGVILFFILCIAGCAALVGGAANEIDKSIKKEQANDRPTVVAAGKAFAHDGYQVDPGWKLAKDFGNTATIKGLHVTNTKADDLTGGGRTALLTFRFYNGKENLAEVTCTGKELQKGESSSMDCSSTDKFPTGFKTIKVADLF